MLYMRDHTGSYQHYRPGFAGVAGGSVPCTPWTAAALGSGCAALGSGCAPNVDASV